MGDLDLSVPASGALKYLKKLKPSSKGKKKVKSGEGQMRILRRLLKVLKYLPGKAQDLRAYFLSMQYWLSGSDDNVREMVRFLVNRYSGDRFAAVKAELPQDYPEVGLYHPSTGIVTDIAELGSRDTCGNHRRSDVAVLYPVE